MKIALGQINTTIGDFSGNGGKIIEFSRRALAAGAGLAMFPELSICGYPPRDLVENPSFVKRNQEMLERIAEQTRGIAVICGLVTPAHAESGKSVMNSAALTKDGQVAFRAVEDAAADLRRLRRMRNFAPASKQELLPFCGRQVALTICEDAWNDKSFWNRQLYGFDPVEALMGGGGNLLLNISASPFYAGKRELRQKMLAALATKYGVPVAMVNQVGGNDSLVFDGSSVVIAPDGRVVAQAKSFEEDLIFFDTEKLAGDLHPQIEGLEGSVYAALVLGTRDYVRKCGFERVLVGLSGGIDSALTAAIAVDALGNQNVIGVGMPGPYSSSGSIEDARALARNLGIRFELIPITEIFDGYRKALQPVFAGREEDVTEENIQARIRGALLMALSNKFGAHGAEHGQQVGAGGGLLHAVRRHGRRAGGDLRRAQDPGVPPGAVRECAQAGDPAGDAGKSRRRPSCGRIKRTATRCRPTTCWTRSWKTTSRTTRARSRLPRSAASISTWCAR